MRRVGFGAATLLIGVVVAAAAYVLHVRAGGRDVVGSSTIEFTTSPAPVHRREPRHSRTHAARTLAWASYGLGPARLRSTDIALRPPFHLAWTWHGGALLEFPPVVVGGRLFLSTFDGRFYALDARTGRAVWRFGSGRCGWSSPAVAGSLVVATFIGRVCAADVPGKDGNRRRLRPPGRNGRLAADDRADRVLATRRARPRLRRGLEWAGVGPRRSHRRNSVGVSNRRRGEEFRGPCGRSPLHRIV